MLSIVIFPRKSVVWAGVASVAMVASLAAHADAAPENDAARDAKQTVNYQTFQKETLALHPWKGKHVVVLVSRTDLDPAVMARLVGVLDRVFEYYRDMTGSTPTKLKATSYEDRQTIATVDRTCGAGCAYVGAAGIELMNSYFNDLYRGIEKRKEFDQVVFYEFGRNFFFYNDQIQYRSDASNRPVVTGYAVFMRFMAMEAAGVNGAAFRGKPFPEFRRVVEGLVDAYEGDSKLTWENTLRIDRAPKNPMGLNGTDLFASFLFRLRRDYGGDPFVKRLWREVARRPKAKSTQEAIDNFVVASSVAADRDLGPLFADRWKWPVSPAARDATKGLKRGP